MPHMSALDWIGEIVAPTTAVLYALIRLARAIESILDEHRREKGDDPPCPSQTTCTAPESTPRAKPQ